MIADLLIVEVSTEQHVISSSNGTPGDTYFIVFIKPHLRKKVININRRIRKTGMMRGPQQIVDTIGV